MYTEISINKLKHYIDEIRQSELEIRRQRWQLTELRMNIASTPDNALFPVVRNLKEDEAALRFEEEKVKKLRVGLERIVALYEDCEEDILEFEETKTEWSDFFISIDLDKLRELINRLPIFKY